MARCPCIGEALTRLDCPQQSVRLLRLRVIVWSNQEGLYGGLTASATTVEPESKLNHAYYEQEVSSEQILMGSAKNPSADPLRDALPTRAASK